jgi:hypothetical protein
MQRSERTTRAVLAGWIGLLLLSAVPAHAAEPQPQPPAGASSSTDSSSTQPQEPQRRADFLFGRPRGSVGLRGSWLFAGAGSDLFDFVTRQLTLDKKDFNSPGLGADVSFALTDRLDLQGGFEWNRVSRPSEYRDFVDNQLLPIEQTTELKTIELGATLRYALTPRGHQVSRLAWLPNRFVPYVGAGGGVIRYDFQQSGDFVDFVDLSVFPEFFRSQGWAPSVHALGGVHIRLYRGLYGSVEARYTKASGKLSSDFIDFDPLDLSGVRTSAGIRVLF